MNRARILAAITVAACALATSSAWAERTLLIHDGTSVFAAGDGECLSGSVNIHVESTQTDVFERQSERMQSLVDSTQAVLRYECPDLDLLQIEGYLAGLQEPVYSGSAQKSDGWIVQALTVVSSSTEMEAAPAFEADDDSSRIAIASVSLDQTVEEVQQRLSGVFGMDPAYDPESGVLNLEQGDCPRDYAGRSQELQPDPDWVCVKGWFTDQRIARLYRMHYTQVRERSVEEIRGALIDHFGSPVVDRREDGAHKLVWVAAHEDSNGNEASEELEATIWESGNMAVLDLSLFNPELAAIPANGDGESTASGILKL